MRSDTKASGSGGVAVEPAAPAASDKIPAHVWRTAGVVVFGAVMGMLDTSLVNIGLRTIGADLGASLATIQWVASAYLLALGVSLTVCGWLARRVGVTRLWLGALVAFTLTSVLCAFAPTAGWLIGARILQGLAAGLMIPAGQTILGQAAGPQRMGRVMGVVGIAVVGAPAIGPTIGGLMLAHWSWEWLFLINIPFGLAGLALGPRYLPRSSGMPTQKLDIVGVVLAGGGVSAVVYGLGEIAVTGSATSASVWLPVVLGLAGLAGFLTRALRTEQSLLDIRLFGNRAFRIANTASFFAGGAMFGVMVLLPLYFQVLHGTGLVCTDVDLLAYGLGGIVMLPLGGRLTDRFGGGRVAVIGNLAIAAAVLPFAFLPADANGVLIQSLLFVAGMATGVGAMPLVSSAYASVRREQLPDATAFVNILQRVGGAVAVAVVAVILSRAASSGWSPVSGYHLAFGVLAALSVVASAASTVLYGHQRRA
ncbi:DHA2 family efflux MFS transporter permease subunit [Nocardia seriolae]|nr:DHA2 family efflux MFS transporter permease subunit [Nocardia seriolae]MTJ64906.1 DHA2 family efflux MFS transporter permease subunit [Nocardia seriolae]MTJ70932.1 DHA2 family efflux MFS transporter permease subunit [Nocardia seriolae]MTJ89723.1 DHA2 family efflux MFS transporter permease subunit [Nocardia seriolae]MTK33698.1 DHA2 family efflux MFS transporter permease subunit [Nocardia seriolae]MTK42851.1 DHA2 family efflux MFS transporter permease subunit [Nocardia seriolae]